MKSNLGGGKGKFGLEPSEKEVTTLGKGRETGQLKKSRKTTLGGYAGEHSDGRNLNRLNQKKEVKVKDGPHPGISEPLWL